MRSSARYRVFMTMLALGAALAVPAAQAQSPACPDTLQWPVHFYTHPVQPCEGDSVSLVAMACRPCVDLVSLTRPQTGPIQLHATMDVRGCLRDVCVPDTVRLGLGRFRSGSYTFAVQLNGVVLGSDGSVCRDTLHLRTGFSIVCPPPPPPIPGDSLPFIDSLVVGRPIVCVTDPCVGQACPYEPIPVTIRGTFPTPCYALRSVELISSGSYPATLRILIDDHACSLLVCPAVRTPWAADVMMAPLPPGNYYLPIETAVVACADSLPSDSSVHRAFIPFVVLPSCGPQPDCFTFVFHGDGETPGCHATVHRGRPDNVALAIHTSRPMAGLQGDLVLTGTGVRIANLTPIGRASGMKLQWVRTAEGARFVLFSHGNAPIGPYPLDDLPGGWPVLSVSLEWAATLSTPGLGILGLTNTLATDSLGGEIPLCPYRRLDPSAMICTGARCDLNADGLSDVRDLVLMVRCVTRDCTTAVDLDCDRDGLVRLEDVLCCARHVLASDGLDTNVVRMEPDVRVVFGAAREAGGALELPIVLRAAHRVGGAKLALRYPAEAFDVLDVRVEGSSWLGLHEVREGKVVIGLVALGPPGEGAAELPITLRLAPRLGQASAGVVQLVESDFSGPDGARLGASVGQPTVGLALTPRVALSAGRPNPFSASARFTLELAAAGDLEVVVHDLHGRLVRRLFRGTAEAGTRDVTWDGRDAAGRIQPSGVYFVRAAIAGHVDRRRIVLLAVR